jgi:DNA-binding GntR family transcriptional regulator
MTCLAQAIVAYGHETLCETWRPQHLIRLAFAAQAYTPEVLRQNALDHRRVIDAIASGDPAEAERVTRMDRARILGKRGGGPEYVA